VSVLYDQYTRRSDLVVRSSERAPAKGGERGEHDDERLGRCRCPVTPHQHVDVVLHDTNTQPMVVAVVPKRLQNLVRKDRYDLVRTRPRSCGDVWRTAC